jgi:hypothetical protein
MSPVCDWNVACSELIKGAKENGTDTVHDYCGGIYFVFFGNQEMYNSVNFYDYVY